MANRFPSTGRQAMAPDLRGATQPPVSENRQIAQVSSCAEVRQLLHELQVHQIEMEMQNEELRRSSFETHKALTKYANLYAFAPLGYCTFDENGLILESNLTGARLLGMDRSRLLQKSFTRFVVDEDRDIFRHQRRQVLATLQPQACELRLKGKAGRPLHVRLVSTAVQDSAGDFCHILTAITDISELVDAHLALQKDHDELEARVDRRTAELLKANAELKKEIAQRKAAEHKLEARTREVEQKSLRLAETITALKVLLKQRESDKSELEEKVFLNIQELIRPYLEKLKKGRLKENQKAYVDIIDSNLSEVTSPLARKLAVRFLKLTSTEIHIANLIERGKTTKEIAEILHVAASTIDFHRHNIRRKLGLSQRNLNLKTYLITPP
jgi:PAS domain S-box-containing protein